MDEKIRKVGQERLRHSLLVQKLYPQTEEELLQQLQFAREMMLANRSKKEIKAAIE